MLLTSNVRYILSLTVQSYFDDIVNCPVPRAPFYVGDSRLGFTLYGVVSPLPPPSVSKVTWTLPILASFRSTPLPSFCLQILP